MVDLTSRRSLFQRVHHAQVSHLDIVRHRNAAVRVGLTAIESSFRIDDGT